MLTFVHVHVHVCASFIPVALFRQFYLCKNLALFLSTYQLQIMWRIQTVYGEDIQYVFVLHVCIHVYTNTGYVFLDTLVLASLVFKLQLT